MEVVYLLIPLSLVLIVLIIWALLWAVRSGQFEDLEGPAYRVLMDDDEKRVSDAPDQNEQERTNASPRAPDQLKD